MGVRTLQRLFEPRSIAVIGASNTPHRVGSVIMRNLLEGGFSGPIMPVNPKHRAVAGVLTYPDIAGLPETPDLAVVATPPPTVPRLLAELGARGTRTAIVLTMDPERRAGTAEATVFRKAILDAAAPHRLRILGAGSLGLLVPRIGLNASFAHIKAHAGRIAFVSQSGALCTAVLDWARPKGIGFSHFIALGDCADIDFGDVLDVLGSDHEVRAILLYIETIRERRNFVAAARTAARNKPVLVVKAGQKAPSHRAGPIRPAGIAEAMTSPDDVYDAVIRRAGMLRVADIDELFAAVETLARMRRRTGDGLAVMANGGGLGVMAVDALLESGGRLASLSDATVQRLDTALAQNWSRSNPIDMEVGASAERYAEALQALIADDGVDATLVMHSPSAIASSDNAAHAVIDTTRRHGGLVLTSWFGGEAVAPARKMFADAGLASYDTPRQAVRAFLHLVNYNRNQEMLMQTPPSAPAEFAPRTQEARTIVRRALAETGGLLSGPAAKAVLAAYDVPVAEGRFARTPEEAGVSAAEVGFPTALSIISPDIPHKWEVGGVALQLGSREAVAAAARRMTDQVRREIAGARIDGFSVQRMTSRPHARQLMIGVTTAPLFGPVIIFGDGGRSAAVVRDHAVGLPPLNLPLAADLISRTRVKRLLAAHHGRPAVELDALCLSLVKVSQLIVDIPEVVALDINPLFADENGVLVIDAEIRADAHARTDPQRLSIQPYPKGLEEPANMRGRPILLRPIRPEDEKAQQVLMSRTSREDIRFRFFHFVPHLEHMELARFTQIDYDREMAFIAEEPGPGGALETLGEVRTVTDPDNLTAEFSVLVRSDLKGQGLGSLLMRKMIRYCRERGTRVMVGQVLADNPDMLRLARHLGFESRRTADNDIVEVRLVLNEAAPSADASAPPA